MVNKSIEKIWTDYLKSLGENPINTNKIYTSWYFCDNKQDADELAQLVMDGIKKATASLYLFYESENEELPKVGDLSVITNWEGEAKCIIRTSNIDIVPFKDVTEEFAQTEGEGDKSLKYWKRAHSEYFSREVKELGKEFNENMLVVCEKFEVVYK
ncbi:MAG TPA: ASCH domain-containing protein [Sedimentibacter sp.]|nr:ASCH domain-containing protein [Sedimentibacter sp.]